MGHVIDVELSQNDGSSQRGRKSVDLVPKYLMIEDSDWEVSM